MREDSLLTLAAKNIRAELRQRYPQTAFSVRSRTYAGGNSVSVVWAGGPTAEEVMETTKKYKEGYFDGMTDSYVYDHDPQTVEFHRLHGSAKYVMLQRRRAA